MKKLLLIVALLIILPGSLTVAQSMTGSGSVMFTGVRYDDGIVATMGYGHRITGNTWTFQYMDVGGGLEQRGSWSSEIGAFYTFKNSGLSIGGIAGPGVDWVNFERGDDENPVAYLIGSVGGILSYRLSDWGLAIWGKYRFNPEKNEYVDGETFGAVVFLDL